MNNGSIRSLGAIPLEKEGTHLRVWAPKAKRLDLHLLSPDDRYVPMTREERGYFSATVKDAGPGARYMYRIDGDRERPDPASRFQPEGVHGPSEVVTPSFDWQDEEWKGTELRDYLFYELHVGTFTKEGTFDAVIPYLDELKELGITAVEIMPVAQFPGKRNWGYDGTYLYAVQNSYGGPQGLKRLVNECHRRGLTVCLDVVYNHLGPEGNYLWDYGPYFTERYKTPWGEAVNFDDADSDEVREFFLQNARQWFEEFHIDALRLDAVHAIYDFSAYPFLQELGDKIRELAARLGRPLHLIPESDLNNTRLIRPQQEGGYALDAQWSDDFHHALHTMLTGEREGYYADYGRFEDLAKVMREGYTYCGEYSAFRRRRHGNNPEDLPAERFVVCAQNHDQVGNRMMGERLTELLDFESLKLAAATTILSPFLPLLFMGEEYGEPAPFLYFVDHGDEGLIEAVRQGRREEFAEFHTTGKAPDPVAPETMQRSVLSHELKKKGNHRVLRNFYQQLIALRQSHPLLKHPQKEEQHILDDEEKKVMLIHRVRMEGEAIWILNFSRQNEETVVPDTPTNWVRKLDSANEVWNGPGSKEFEQPASGGTRIILQPRSAILITTEA